MTGGGHRSGAAWAAVGFAAGVAAAAPARADDTADEAEFRFQRAAEFYGKNKFDEALGEFWASYRLVKNRNVLFNIARCYERTSRHNEAYRYYNDLLSEPMSASEKGAIREALARLKSHVALVRIESEPAGGEIYVDRKDLGARGQAPKVLALPPGRVAVIVELGGYHPSQKAVTLAKGTEVKVAIALARIYGTLDVQGTEGAEVRLDRSDGPVLCTVPCKARVLPGKHSIHVSLAGRATTSLDTEVPPEGTAKLAADLPAVAAPKGALVVTANRTGALIRVDGKEAGFTPAVVDLEEGEHTVDVAFEDFETWSGTVQIAAGGKAIVNAILTVAQPKVVAAAKTAMRAEDAPASVTVITSEELRAFGYITLAEALRGVRGFFNTYDRVYQYLGVRGFSPPGDYSNRVLVLLDGHPLVELWSGGNYVGHDFDVDLSLVDHIEVVRGPGSALYGTAAFFAVVNVVPRQPPLGAHGEVGGGAGSMSTAWGRGTLSYDAEHLGVLATGATYRSGGEEAVPYDRGMTPVVGRDGESADHLAARVRAGPFTLFGVFQVRTKAIPSPPSPGESPAQAGPPTATDGRHFGELKFEKAFGDRFTLAARGYVDLSRYSGTVPYDEPEAFFYDTGGATWYGAEVRAIVGPFLRTRLTVGAEGQLQEIFHDSRQGTVTPLPFTTYRELVVSAYGLFEIRPVTGLALSPGVRYDNYGASFGSTVNPRIGLVAQPYPGGVSKMILGSAFRAPTILERYYHDQGATGATQMPAEGPLAKCPPKPKCPPLAPEQVVTAELEHSHMIGESLTATIAGYGSQITQLIELGTVPDDQRPGETLIQYQNTPELIRAVGAEVELRYRPERLLLATASYGLQFVRRLSGLKTANSPQHLATVRLMAPLASATLVLGLEVNYASPRLGMLGAELGETLGVALTLSGELPRYHLRYSIHAGNLRNERVDHPGGNEVSRDAVPQPGTQVRAQLAFTF